MMNTTINKYTIISIGANCENYIKNNLSRSFNQTYKNYNVVLLDDFSNDNTVDNIFDFLNIDKSLKDNEIIKGIYNDIEYTLILNKSKNMGMPNVLKTMSYIDENNIVVIVDLDDYLYHIDVLNVLEEKSL